jgi:BirA family biotin operon repressor/biotin-[acetyl-CoA-carboxylase] ligase
MDTAKEMADDIAKEGTVVIADRQTEGRGRNGRTWDSPPGGLYLSLILKPRILVFEAHKLIFLSGTAVAEALRRTTGRKMEIKWPNDIIHADKKVGGLLCETSSLGKTLRFAVLGIGINTNVPRFSTDLEGGATSLLQIAGKEVDNDQVAERIMQEISTRYENFPENFQELLAEWKNLTNTLGRDVLLEGEMFRAIDIDEEGFLLVVDKEGKEKRIVSGTVDYP